MPRTKGRPRRLRNKPKRTVVGRRVGMFGRYKRRPARAVEYASCKESFNTNIVAGVLNYYNAITLSDAALIRAPAIAKNYQFYKITKVEMRVIPKFDTFTAGGQVVKPYIFWMIDKGNVIPAGQTFATIQNLGCKPRILDETTRNFSFAPAVQTVDAEVGAVPLAGVQYKVSPWLNTLGGGLGGLSAVDHAGCVYGITVMQPGDATQYNVQITYHFKFKKPLVVPGQGVESNTAQYNPATSTYDLIQAQSNAV